MAQFLCLPMQIMLISRSFFCCQRVLVGQWPEWPSSAIVLAVVRCFGNNTMQRKITVEAMFKGL